MTEPLQNLFALAGNPNCGKTTLFNAITGARQHVGNYPESLITRRTPVNEEFPATGSCHFR